MKKVLDNFIVLEGLDGSGTTTQLEKIAERFDRDEKAVHATFEPTTSALGKLVRSVLKKDLVTTPLALAMMFAADREDHLNNPVHGITHRLSGERPSSVTAISFPHLPTSRSTAPMIGSHS